MVAEIPETVTVPGQLVYDAIVRMSAIETGLLRLNNNSTSGLTEELLETYFRLYEAAFGPYYQDNNADDADPTPLAQQTEEDGWQLLRECLGLDEKVGAHAS
jgi:hypothetical protein